MGCSLCKRVSGAADKLGVPVDRYDEHADGDVWAVAGVPGAPYAVALDRFGLVLAKGTVNDGTQLRSVLAAAEARVRAAAQVERPGADSSRRAFLARAAAGVAGASLASGLVDLVRADQPYLFTSPVSLSFGDIDVNRGPQTRALATQLDDAGGGAGTWSVELLPQAASAGATVEPDPLVTIPPGGSDRLGVTVRARADAAAGDNLASSCCAAATSRVASPTTSRSRVPGSSSGPPRPFESSTRATRATAFRTRARTASRRGPSARRPTIRPVQR